MHAPKRAMRTVEQSAGPSERVPSQLWDTTRDGSLFLFADFLFGLFRF
jgi:hypothetical protein